MTPSWEEEFEIEVDGTLEMRILIFEQYIEQTDEEKQQASEATAATTTTATTTTQQQQQQQQPPPPTPTDESAVLIAKTKIELNKVTCVCVTCF